MSPPLVAWFTWWLVPAIVGGLVAAFIVLLFVVALAERNPVHGFDPTPLSTPPPNLPPYVAAMNASAARAGYFPGGLYAHVKGRTHKTYASLWQSPDRRVLVEITGGTTLKIVRRNTKLYSRTSADRYLVTADEFDAGDTSGIQDGERILNADFEELLVAHLRRVQALGPQGVPPFEATTTLEARREVDDRLLAAVMARGFGRWVNAERSVWSYSAKGAAWLCTVGMFREMGRSVGQNDRASKPRPGDRAHGGFAAMIPPAPPAAPPVERDFLP